MSKTEDMLSDDLAQETFIKAYLNIRSFKGISAFSTWLFRIAYNTFYDSTRAKKRFEYLNTSEIDKKASSTIEYSAEKSDIYTALKLLSKEEKAVILHCYMEEMTHKETAKILNLPLGTIKTHILKAKEKMGKFLKEQGYGK